MEIISRAALILFSPAVSVHCSRSASIEDSSCASAQATVKNRGICALFGMGRSGLTTLGGRIAPGETWLDCLVRELIEETRGILDYSLYKEIFTTAKHVCFDHCMYVLFETDIGTLESTAARFPTTASSRDVCNEMLSLEVCLIDDLIKDMVVGKKNRYNETFQSMFLAVGYDALKGNTCNHITSKIDLDAEVHVPISQLPRVVCLTPIRRDTPVIYGTILSRRLFITDQFYLEEKDRCLYRSGWLTRSE